MNFWLFYGLLTALISVYAVLCIRAKSSDNLDDFYLGNRSIHYIPLTLAFLAVQLGGGSIIGSAEAAYGYGLSGLLYVVGIALGLIVLASGLGPRLRSCDVATIPELLQRAYGSVTLRRIASVIMISSLFGVLIALAVAVRKFTLGLGFTGNYLAIGLWLVLVAYSAWGGFNVVVKAEELQIGLVLFGFVAVWAAMAWGGGPNVDLKQIVGLTDVSYISWLDWIIMPMCFTIIGQDMGQRCFAAQSPKIVSYATITAGIVLVACAILPVYLGASARILGLDFADGGVLMFMVTKYAGPEIASFFALAILLAILSTVDAVLCAVSSNISYDFLQKQFTANLGRFITVVTGLLALLMSFELSGIIEIMVFAYGLTVSSLFVPVLLAVFNIPVKRTVWFLIILGITINIGFALLGIKNGAVTALCFSIIIGLIGYLKSQDVRAA